MEKLTIKEAANYLKMSLSGINSAIYKRKQLSVIKHNRNVFICKTELDGFKEQMKNNFKSRRARGEIDYEPIRVKILEMFKDNISFKEISKALNIPYVSVKREISKADSSITFDRYDYKFTEIEKINLRKARDYYYENNNNSLEMVSKEFNISVSVFRTYLKRTDGAIKSRSSIRSFVRSPNFFDNIDCELKAYLLGFIAADGHIENESKGSSCCLKVSVSIKDYHILKLFNNALCEGKGSIRVPISKLNKMVEFSVRSNEIGKTLQELGFNNRKTYNWVKLPNIDNSYMPHFIRGYFDGDGSIMIDPSVSNSRLSGVNRKAAFICFNKTILEQIVNLIKFNSFNLRETVESKSSFVTSNTPSWILEVSNLEELNKLHKYLYTNANYYFKRKKDKFDLAILNSEQIEAALQGNLY